MDLKPGGHIEYAELVDAPVYRVHFWSITPGYAPALDAFLAFGAADVREVLDWVDAAREGRPVEIFALTSVSRSLDQDPEEWWVRLLGESPLTPP
ncbi:MAG: hypothetical protein AB7H92_12380 [Microbacteriaceae bacterium]|jgi:hypothetical protein